MRRVVISGIGLVSPLGTDLSSFWEALIHGRSGIGPITRFDASTYSCRIGGQVDDEALGQWIEPRLARRTTHVSRLALAAVELALCDGRVDLSDCDPNFLGVCLGTATAGMREAEQQFGVLREHGARRVNPFIVSGIPSHGPGAEVAAKLGARGSHFTFGTGCPASLQAVAHGAQLVASGELEVCIAGGAESPLLPTTFAALGRTQELTSMNEQPERASRPFDRCHSGIVLSEGSCFLVLEAFDRVIRRGASAYAEILGSSSSCDALGMHYHDSSGGAGALAIGRALAKSNLRPSQVEYVCAHANSSPAFDRKEIAVLQRAFGESAARLAVSSIKAVLGHPFGASGAFQVATSALAIKHQLIPPTHNLETPDPECNLDCVPGKARAAPIQTALVTSYGYGGINSALLVGSPRL